MRWKNSLELDLNLKYGFIKLKNMSSFIIEGGHRLKGNITPQGAKNEALQVICATLLTRERVTIENIPDILDVNNLIELLHDLGVEINKIESGVFTFKSENIDISYTETEEFRRKSASMRGSIMLAGPLLARFGEVVVPKPGGDKIGRRRLDTHFNSLMKLGADLTNDEKNQLIRLSATKLKGKYILLDEASVTGTANLIMAAVLSEGETVIYNAACEPYIEQLSRMLVRMGARIEGIGSNKLFIKGVTSLNGCKHRLLPDMIETGSFIGMAAMTESELTIRNTSIENLGIIPESFRRLGITIEQRGDDLYIPSQKSYTIDSFMDGSIITISDAPWPGLTPDLLSVMLVVATKAKGSVLIHQKMFESRLFFVDKLIDMGAQIILCDPHRAVVIGLDERFYLRGTTMTSPDIRAGISLLIAAMCADGVSTIHNIDQIDRGYQDIDKRLNELGASIVRK
jgi:UDP-N-acetylglucosamine 1-carboxyvinyltransferase